MTDAALEGLLPPGFIASLPAIFSLEQMSTVERSFVQRPTIVRINQLKTDPAAVCQRLRGEGFLVRDLPLCSYAFVVEGRESVSRHPLVASGELYLQSVASLAVPIVLDPHPGDRVLDLCAAPGSKASQIGMLMQREGELVANEPSHARFFKLKAVLEGQGVFRASDKFCVLAKADGYALVRRYQEYFDRVLVDAPCSGEARFVVGEVQSFGAWKMQQRKKCASLQKKLLGAALMMTKPGGHIVYSTCTLAREENEEIVAWALDRFGDQVLLERIPPLPLELIKPQADRYLEEVPENIRDCSARLMPNATVESFFMARFRKRQAGE